MVKIIGLAAAGCTTLSFLPQAIKTIKTKQTEDLSLGMYSFFTLGVSLWLTYGIIIKDLPVILANKCNSCIYTDNFNHENYSWLN